MKTDLINIPLAILEESQIQLAKIYQILPYFEVLFHNDIQRKKEEVDVLRKKIDPEFVKKYGKLKMKDIITKYKDEPDFKIEFLNKWATTIALAENEGLIKLSESYIPNFIWSSIYAITYAKFEHHLNEFCLALSPIKKIPFISKNNESSTLEAYKNFLKESLNFEFGVSEHWPLIKVFNDIRNIVLHYGGYLDDSDRAFRVTNFINNRKDIICTDDKLLVISRFFVDELLSVLSEFFEQLEMSVKSAT